MRAIEISEFGEAENLSLIVVTDPEPGPNEVLIEVVAAGVNRADVMQRKGHYPPPPGTSELPGLEVSGRIAALGSEVSGWEVGQEVCALLAGGGYAEKVVVDASLVLPLPAGVSVQDAAALPEVVATVYSNLIIEAGLKAGETVLIHGGSSGIGTMAIQIASALGARVAVTAGSDKKLEVCRQLGADITINYREQDFVESLLEATDGAGADVILDVVGAAYLGRNVKALASAGRIVVIGLLGGAKGELPIGLLLSKRGRIIATSLRARPLAEKAEIVSAVREQVWPQIAAGSVRPIIDGHYPLADATRAHRDLEASQHIGKLLLLM
ncbi:NAD(P)H-quinone oxidoreductase [Ornithinimicrobium sp. INDO-MA30-4]|uniref:NAD(P)H-quinone oxidoreductase n=1 Tax=Ornithinimicrobium sp. INDO-MA30-4 TaxID=2908651 RepID=UPI001F2FC344|nr:NAD(P)H-quinone oxidoreductase [Ornithinimicrobium sp. INDO-MA30-4]UJH70281.1 NAD(P)H-quinone oxidoreductase [Ornithinimicrobium sp. INDO-MA30-4]